MYDDGNLVIDGTKKAFVLAIYLVDIMEANEFPSSLKKSEYYVIIFKTVPNTKHNKLIPLF